VLDGFWLPRQLRERVLGPDDQAVERWDAQWFRDGREVPLPVGDPDPAASSPGSGSAVGARWPRLSADQWERLLAALSEGRQHAPTGPELRRRLGAALRMVGASLAHAGGSPTASAQTAAALAALSAYTGYSPEMISFALAAPALWSFDDIESAMRVAPTCAAAERWVDMLGLPGRLRFFPATSRWTSRRSSRSWPFGRLKTAAEERPIFGAAEPPDLAVGYGAGNVPGTALIIAVLVLAATLAADRPPVLLVRNSRREPIFAPLVLHEIERVDPELVGTIAMLVWDHEDGALQHRLLARADLAVAAAGDAAIARLREQTVAAGSARFHAHGHKVSFTAISREALGSPLPLDDLALLAALDSAMWDQNGCLSSRVHFVEAGPTPTGPAAAGCPPPGTRATHTVHEYAEALAGRLRLLAAVLPRGSWPRSTLHDRFDHFATLTATGAVQLLSAYDDDFVVVLDERSLGGRGDRQQTAAAFAALVNQCQGRVVVVRPINDLMDIPRRYLSLLPPTMLQSLSVAVGPADPAARPSQDGLDPRLLSFAEECGACGVTSIRPVGRGAFPQLAYSWDGLLPLDLVRRRAEGWFTTIECDRPYATMLATAEAVRRQLHL
jgi:hypothetical protein